MKRDADADTGRAGTDAPKRNAGIIRAQSQRGTDAIMESDKSRPQSAPSSVRAATRTPAVAEQAQRNASASTTKHDHNHGNICAILNAGEHAGTHRRSTSTTERSDGIIGAPRHRHRHRHRHNHGAWHNHGNICAILNVSGHAAAAQARRSATAARAWHFDAAFDIFTMPVARMCGGFRMGGPPGHASHARVPPRPRATCAGAIA